VDCDRNLREIVCLEDLNASDKDTMLLGLSPRSSFGFKGLDGLEKAGAAG
jgi:hypothetical protein